MLNGAVSVGSDLGCDMSKGDTTSSISSMAAALRLALIGYGHAGRGIHARLAREAGFQVTAVVVNNQNRRQLAASDWPGARFVNKVSDLVALRGLFDLAVIASPTSNHAENAAVLARAGIPFVIDKPMGIDAFEARAIIDETKATHTPFTVFFNRRWDGEQVGLVNVLRTGELGDIHTFERRWERFAATDKHQWREDDIQGGGVLLDLHVHLVDQAIELFGPVKTVSATIRSLKSAADDDVMLVLTHEAGGGVAKSKFPVISRLFASTVVGAPGPRTRALGTKAAYVTTGVPGDFSAFEVVPSPDRGSSTDKTSAAVLGKPASEAAKKPVERDKFNRAWIVRGTDRQEYDLPPSGEIAFYRALPEWLAGETPPPVDPAAGLRAAIVLDAAREAARTGNTVSITDFTKPKRG